MPNVALINPNTSEATTGRMVEIAQEASPGFRLVGLTAPFGALLITDEAMLRTAGHAVVALLPSLDGGGYAGVIVSAFGDPGLPELRQALGIPVVGIGESGIREAGKEGRRFCVVTTTPGLVPSIDAMIPRLGLAAGYAGVVLTEGDPVAVTNDPARLEAALAHAIDRAIAERQVAAIVIGGGPLADAARTLAPGYGVPIVEPVPAAVRAMSRMLSGGS